MGKNNIGSNISSGDVEKIRNRRNKPEYKPGFEPEDGGGGGLDDYDFNFDAFDLGGDSGGSGGDSGGSDFGLGGGGDSFGLGGNAGGNSLGGTGFGNTGFGGSSIGGNGLGGSSFGSSLGTNPFSNGLNQQQQQAPAKPDLLDTALDKCTVAGESFFHVFGDMVKSFKKRNTEDWGKYFSKVMIVSFICIAASMVISILGFAADIDKLKFTGIPLQIMLGSGATLAISMPGLAFAAYKNEGSTTATPTVTNTTPSVDFGAGDFDFGDDGDDLDSLLGIEDDEEPVGTIEDTPLDLDLDTVPLSEPEEIDYGKALTSVQERVPLLSRPYLVDTFKPFFGCCTPQFSERKTIAHGTDMFDSLETICIKAIAAAAKKELEEVADICTMESATETYFAYEIKVTRYKPLTKTDELAREITAYSRESVDDKGVSTTVEILGDFYVITIYKGNQVTITLGDLFKMPEVVDFFKSEKNILPFCVGITVDGKPLLKDAKGVESMIIAGKPRSGKSWYTLNFLLNIMMFNTPEDVQCILIDPKKTSMFRTLSMMPHVAGFHDDSNILEVLRDIIDIEGERRKKLLMDNKCDTIWELRKRKGIKLPVLYIFIDEVMTVLANLGKAGVEEFTEMMKVIMTQFPYIGIRLVIVPHRAQGVIDKTIREQLNFCAAIRATNDVILETLGLKKFSTSLESPGDVAIKMEGFPDGVYVKGNAVTPSDEGNSELILSIVKAFYKMGFDRVDCRSLGRAYNRNEKEIMAELKDDGTEHIQLDI